MRRDRALAVIVLALIGLPVAAHCSWDPDARTLSNGLLTVQLPAVGAPCEIAILRGEKTVASRAWYFCVVSHPTDPNLTFRSNGETLALEVLEDTPERVAVRTTSATDYADDPGLGSFEMTWALRAGVPVVEHEMTFVPRERMAVRSYHFYVATARAAGDTHRLHTVEPDGTPTAMPARTSAAYGRIALPTRPAWAALEDLGSTLTLSLGAPAADVSRYMYSIDFTRFELSRSGGFVTPSEPLHDFALIGVAEGPAPLLALHRDFLARVERPEREAEPPLPAPDLMAEPELALSPDFEAASGALTRLDSPAGPLLAAAGGVVFVEWPGRTRITSADGQAAGLGRVGEPPTWQWRGRGLRADHRVEMNAIGRTWTVALRNEADAQRLLEVRLELPLAMREGYFWDGLRLVRFDEDALDHELTTTVPGGTQSQGIFPAVCVHDDRAGFAVGIEPMQIESFYGARLQRTEDGSHTLSYVLRWALPPGGEREARFVLYPIDPRWSWRSMVARYWQAWPQVFAAPRRDDVWGLYSAASPRAVFEQGDRFIERCRRLRVGAMELYAPFNRTGDFYPDDGPAYERGDFRLTREQMRAMYDTSDIACCTISYVIPTKCERELATTSYADSVIRTVDGSMFLSDQWDVMGGGTEKLAAMFACGDSFGENLYHEVRQIVESYAPEGFYFDNGAFTWLDYGRETPWSAFDDDGRVWTNAGIAYAKLQDMLEEFAPQVHRNPGEFIQYFSGFRGHSHLTNIVGSQRYYIRSHRLIMGRKPIYPGHPQRIATRDDVYDMLELGGLPWLNGQRLQGERLAQAWAPVAVALARAGWRPVTDAVADDARVTVERFGDEDARLFTVRNHAEEPVTATVTVRGELPGLRDFFGRLDVRAEVADGLTRVSVPTQAREMVFLTTAPVPAERAWPPARFLAQAEPVSIIAESDAKECVRMARRVKGFVEEQAALLGREAQVEIVGDAGQATYDAQVAMRLADSPTRIDQPAEKTLTVAFADEAEATRVLSEFLDTIALPLSDDPAAFLP